MYSQSQEKYEYMFVTMRNQFKSKAGESPFAPLPLEKIANFDAFQSTGIDMAGS